MLHAIWIILSIVSFLFAIVGCVRFGPLRSRVLYKFEYRYTDRARQIIAFWVGLYMNVTCGAVLLALLVGGIYLFLPPSSHLNIAFGIVSFTLLLFPFLIYLYFDFHIKFLLGQERDSPFWQTQTPPKKRLV